jgi:DNA-binding cell septation regulator SpoVG
MAKGTDTNTAVATQVAAPENPKITVGLIDVEVVNVRPIQPKGALIGYANIKFGSEGNSITVPDFPIFNGETGLFVKNPSRQDEKNPRFFRDTAQIQGDEMKTAINVVVRDGYVNKVQEMQARATAALGVDLKQPRIADQLAKAGQEAARDNANRQPPQRGERVAAQVEH